MIAAYTNTSDNKHLNSIDYIRAIASLSVAIFHLGGKVLPVLNYGWLGVEMFFVLSGFIICWAIPPSYSWRNAGTFISKRLIRIEPPYLISIMIVVLLNLIFISGNSLDWNNLILHIAYLNNFFNQPYLNPVYWTLGIEFQYYVLIALIFPFLKKTWGKWLIAALTILPVFIHTKGQVIFNLFPLFALGIFLFLYKKKHIKEIEFVLFSVLTVIICFLNFGIPETISGIVALTIMLLPLKSNFLISFFSKISFSLYLTHDIFGSKLVVFIGTLLPKTIFYKGSIFVFGILISIIIAYIFYTLIELPFLNKSKLIQYSFQKKSLIKSNLQVKTTI